MGFELYKHIKKKLVRLLEKRGIHTGSSCFFEVDETSTDFDYVITMKELHWFEGKNNIMFKNLMDDYSDAGPNDDVFSNYKFESDEINYDIIIVKKKEDKYRWEYATKMMLCHLDICANVSFEKIEDCKEHRVRVFETFKQMYDNDPHYAEPKKEWTEKDDPHHLECDVDDIPF